MSEEELIETLRALEKNIVEQLEEPARNLFYAIMKIADERDRLNNIIEEYKNANKYHQKIIHELETMKQPNQLHSENVKLRAENNRLNTIIKEVREYIKVEKVIKEGNTLEQITNYEKKLLGILDKEGK